MSVCPRILARMNVTGLNPHSEHWERMWSTLAIISSKCASASKAVKIVGLAFAVTCQAGPITFAKHYWTSKNSNARDLDGEKIRKLVRIKMNYYSMMGNNGLH